MDAHRIKKETIKDFVSFMNNSVETAAAIGAQPKKQSSLFEIKTAIKRMLEECPVCKSTIYHSIITQIMRVNNDVITARMLTPLGISRQYLKEKVRNGEIEKVSRGVYISSDAYEDSYFTFQQKQRKAIFSHLNALYFYGLTEEFPYNYTVTVPRGYHSKLLEEKCTVFYAKDSLYRFGKSEIKTPGGHKVITYDAERSICDIIKAKTRIGEEQVRKALRNYVDWPKKDLNKLLEYAKKMGVYDDVATMIGVYYG